MAVYTLPVRAGAPWHDFTVELDGRPYVLELAWNARAAAWFLHVRDADGGPLLMGLKLVVGLPLLRRFRHEDRLPRGELIAVDTQGAAADPGLDDLGRRVLLLYLDAADLAGDA